MAEITTTQAFSDGDTVTATKLNNITANAAIQTEAITNRSAETTVDQANDLLLMYDASATALKKISLSNVIKAGTASNFPVTGNATVGGTLAVTGEITASSTVNGTTIPTSKTLVTTDDTQTLTGKTVNLASNTLAGTLAQFNTSCSDADFASLAGSETLTNKTLTSPVISGGTINNTVIGGTTAAAGSFTILSAQAGTAASPAIVPTGDTNTGIFFPAADTIAFSEGGTESMRIDSSGRVGIGTSSPSESLEVAGSAPKIKISATSNSSVQLLFNSNLSGVQKDTGSIYYLNNEAMTFQTQGTERLRIDSSGNVGIGEASPTFTSGGGLHIKNATRAQLRLQDSTTNVFSEIGIADNATTSNFLINVDPTNIGSAGCYFAINTAGTERLRITSGGEVCVGRTSSGAKLHIYNSGSTDARVTYFEKASGTTDGLYLVCYAGVTTHFQILGNGNCQNANNSYGAVSDEKIKQDIVDASTQWNDVKNLRVRKFRFKSDPSMPLQIGLVAQEVELVSPHLVEETKDTDRDGNDLGTTTKGVKYSVLYMKAVKALQEAMERIEQLESKVAALEAA